MMLACVKHAKRAKKTCMLHVPCMMRQTNAPGGIAHTNEIWVTPVLLACPSKYERYAPSTGADEANGVVQGAKGPPSFIKAFREVAGPPDKGGGKDPFDRGVKESCSMNWRP